MNEKKLLERMLKQSKIFIDQIEDVGKLKLLLLSYKNQGIGDYKKEKSLFNYSNEVYQYLLNRINLSGEDIKNYPKNLGEIISK